MMLAVHLEEVLHSTHSTTPADLSAYLHQGVHLTRNHIDHCKTSDDTISLGKEGGHSLGLWLDAAATRNILQPWPVVYLGSQNG